MTKDNNNMTDKQLDTIAAKIVARMVKLKSMEDWFHHVSKSEEAWQTYKDLDLDEEVEALGEAAKLMTIMNICQEEEEYEKCAIIKNRMNEVNRILRKYK
jgi:hypothetical protein